MQPIANAVQKAYDLDTTAVNTISLTYMAVFVIMNFPSNYALDTLGIRIGVINIQEFIFGYRLQLEYYALLSECGSKH